MYLKNNEYNPPLEEITLEIKLDLKEDIGLIIIDYEVDDISGSGGISNANKTLISHNDTLTYTLNKQEFNNLSNIENLIINFKIITKYIDPNYENIYPEEYTSIIAPIQIKARALARGDLEAEVDRRLKDDYERFMPFRVHTVYNEIKNNNGRLDEAIREVEVIINKHIKECEENKCKKTKKK